MIGKSLVGRVVSDKMQSTVAVEVESPMRHPTYKKLIVVKKRYLAHADMAAKKGDLVKIIKSRPFSKRTHFVVLEVVKGNKE